jgi:hypothetical protein
VLEERNGPPSCGLSLSWCFRAAVSLCELQKRCARLLRLSVNKDAKTEEFLLTAFNTYSATGGKGRTTSRWLLGPHGTRMSTADKSSRGGTSDGVAKSRRNRVMSLGTLAAIVALVACMHLGFWALKDPNTTAASVEGGLPSVSYNRFA